MGKNEYNNNMLYKLTLLTLNVRDVLMNKLEKARQIINETDKQMAELFCKRMEAARLVAEYKAEHGLPVLDVRREEAVAEKNSAYISDPDIRSYYMGFIKNVMDISKQYQYRLIEGMRVAYSGVEGAFAHIAAEKIFPGSTYVSCSDFAKAYEAVQNGECDCCVLPLENSYAGEVGQVTDLIFGGSLYVNGIYDLQICHNLMGIPGAELSDIKTVISHPQALSQCEGYINFHGFEQIRYKNTALAAKKVAESGKKDMAAIASYETAKLYGLEILDCGINESDGNTTRFAVLSRCETQINDGKFIMMFTVGNVAGALAKAVNIIGEYGFNMQALHSRPFKEESWQYYFYVEAQGNPYSPQGRKMIQELSRQCSKIKIAGCYSTEIKLDGRENGI